MQQLLDKRRDPIEEVFDRLGQAPRMVDQALAEMFKPSFAPQVQPEERHGDKPE
jgi:hypothetical protein